MNSPFHEGELAVQARAGFKDMARRVGENIHATLSPTARRFVQGQQMAIASTIDESGHVWASLLTGKPGFIQTSGMQTIYIDAEPAPGDPLWENLSAGGQFGLLVIDLATRQRVRLNGVAIVGHQGTIHVETRQVYFNCPQYIQKRSIATSRTEPGGASTVQRDGSLTERQRSWVEQADTFFIATSYAGAGADASHRGGNPGFVRVLDGRNLAFPDYAGNRMFQTLGNISANSKAGLLFIDFEHGDTLQLTGNARINWDTTYVATFPGAERVVEFQIDRVIEITNATLLRWQFVAYSRYNPVVKDLLE